MTRICLVGVDNYLMLKPGTHSMPVNGEAVQQVLLARELRKLDFEVSTVVQAVERDIDELIDGIRVISAFKWASGIPIIRFIYPRATGLFRALKEVDADVYYQSCAGLMTGLTAAFCRWRQKKFIFRVASDVDCVPRQQLIELWRDRWLYEYGLRHADLVTVQSRYQQQLLKRHYGLNSTIVNMAVEMPKEDLDGEREIEVLWISNLKPVKRADRVLKLARRLVNTKFTMIGGVVLGEEEYYTDIEREASKLPNISFLGQVPYGEVNQYIAQSKVFLNTSDVEGFPNTFLQAWVRKVPVVSYFDPDGIIAREGLGRRSATEEDMCISLRELLDDRQEREKIGVAANAYAVRNYSPIVAAKRYVELCATL